ncbi:MAG: hypothetical protein M1827_006683 [Pycnora praestabilis]|nr:MAG: hypothetical protein M1827_006683 [Pycnora praestabilis]
MIIACDGTWMDSDNGYVKGSILTGSVNGKLQVPSNVTRICRAINPESNDGTPQIVYYQAGVGTGPSAWDKLIGGGTGMGLSENIREAYAFLAANYNPGDEIFLIGFSRGAFTARSIAGLIGSIGLLTRNGMEDFYEIFKDYENNQNPKYEPEFPDIPYPNKTNVMDPEYAAELQKRSLSRLNIPIKAVGVWETVGSLGIPSIGWLEKMGMPASTKEYSFYNTNIDNHIENAFQALALDERRGPFSPAVWEKPDGCTTNLKQVWFPGVHSNIGGGYADTEMANITLAWMMSSLSPFLDFDPYYIQHQASLNRQYYASHHIPPRSWAGGELFKSLRGIYAVAGKKVRTPGCYHVPSPTTGELTGTPLRNTNEYIHASVRIRLSTLGGPGVGDKGHYECEALRDWRLIGADARYRDNEPSIVAEQKRVRWERLDDKRMVLFEDVLGDLEKGLLEASPEVERERGEKGG